MKIYPKINIALKIIGKEAGFHKLLSRFVLVKHAFYDEMDIESSAKFSICGDFDCPLEQNLIYKAKEVLKAYLAKSSEFKEQIALLDSLKVSVQKAIPQGAGLGGGSANAGAFLNMANEFLKLNLNTQILIKLSQYIGSDVAFFASKYDSANVSGRGQFVEKFDEKVPCFEIYTPKLHCDTKKVYAKYAELVENKRLFFSNEQESRQMLELDSMSILRQYDLMSRNDLYMPANLLYDELDSYAKWLKNENLVGFSGSGSSFFKAII